MEKEGIMGLYKTIGFYRRGGVDHWIGRYWHRCGDTLKRRIYGQLNLGEKDERTPESFNVKYLIIDSDSSKIKDQWRTAAAIDEKEEFFFYPW